MGISGISPGSLLLIFLIVLVIFGTKKLKNLGADLGEVVKNFKKGLEGKTQTSHSDEPDQP